MLNSLTENKSAWYTDFSLQETIFYISWQNCNIFVLAEEFSAGDLKILSEVREPGGICYYYHLCFTDGKLNARKIKNLTENRDMSEICEERENSRSHLVPKYCGCIRPLPIQSSCISPITLYLQASKRPWILSLETITQKVWQRGQNLVKLFNPAMIGKKKNPKQIKPPKQTSKKQGTMEVTLKVPQPNHRLHL